MAIPSNYIDKINKDGDSRPICPAADKVRVENQNFESGDLDGALNELAGGKANKDETYTKEEVNEKVPLRIPATKNGDVITSTTDYAKIDNAVKEDWRDAYVVVNNESIFSFYQVEQNAIIFTRVDAEDGTQAYLAVSSNNVWSIEYSAISGGGYEPPVGGIPKTDLAPGVQTSLGLADTAVQDNDYTHTDNNYTDAEQTKLAGLPTNPVTSISVNGQNPQTPNNGNVNLVVETGAQGKKGDKGDTVVIGDEEEFLIVNDLTTGGEADALSAEMGRRLAMLSGTYAEAWAHAQAIPYIFPWLWVETIDGDAICKPIWHRGSGNFVDAAGGNIVVQATALPSAPTFSETSGSTVGKGTQLTITPAAGSALYYKIDNGSWIVRDMAVTIEVNATCVITAKCVNNYGPSSEATCSLTVSGPAVPSFTAAQGTTIGTGNVVSRGGSIVVSVPQGGELHYSTDGVNYTTASGSSVTIPVPAAGVHIYAYNVEDGDQSSIIDNAYTMAALTAPSFSPAAGTLPMGGGTVAITHTDNNVDIFYTTDGSTPTASSTQYTQPISVTADMTIKAIAKDDYGTSEVASAAYTVPVDHKFQFKIALTGDNSTEYVPIVGAGGPIYNLSVDWGDGTTTDYQGANGADKIGVNKSCSHAYTGSEGDEFVVTLRGSKIPKLHFGNPNYCNTGALIAILDNSLECDTDFKDVSSNYPVYGPNVESICDNALQNNTSTCISFKACSKITSFPSGFLGRLTKNGIALTSCKDMFNSCACTLASEDMALLATKIGSVTMFYSMFYSFVGNCAIPDDFFDLIPNGAITDVSNMCAPRYGKKSLVTGHAYVLLNKLKPRMVSDYASSAVSNALASDGLYQDGTDNVRANVDSAWGGSKSS